MKAHAVLGGGGLRLHVREWGRPDGPPILFIHGWSQNHLCWAKQYESALADEFRLVAFDLRGHGMSEAPLEPEHYTEAGRWADDVAAIVEELRLDRPVLVGWSYGAFVICDYIRAYGQEGVAAINFVEGAPANMLVRLGLRPEYIKPGQEITAIGAPRRDDPNAWFLKAIVLPDGTKFNTLQSPNQTR